MTIIWKHVEVWQFYRDEPFINNNGIIIDGPDDTGNASFKFKQKLTIQTRNDGLKNVQIMVVSKHLSNFWKALEMQLLNCEINIFFLTWLEKWIVITGNYSDQKPKLAISGTKAYVPVVTLSAQDNEKLL